MMKVVEVEAGAVEAVNVVEPLTLAAVVEEVQAKRVQGYPELASAVGNVVEVGEAWRR